MLDPLYGAWKNDIEAGKSSLMIAGERRHRLPTNRLARADRVADRPVSDEGPPGADGQTAGVGDAAVTGRTTGSSPPAWNWVKRRSLAGHCHHR